MIKVKNVSKKYGSIETIKNMTVKVQDGKVFGLIGTNGSGKTTLMKLMCGVIKQDLGTVMIDGVQVYENVGLKRTIFYMSDEAYFPMGYTCEEMKRFSAALYPKFNEKKYLKLMEILGLESAQKIQDMSKGMKKRFSVILGLSAETKYLLLDETFDGMDPVARETVKNLILEEMQTRELTPIIASHNLRELDDVCDHIGLIHNGQVILSEDIDKLKKRMHKVQCVFEQEEVELFEKLNICSHKKVGSVHILTIQGDALEILDEIKAVSPVFAESIPLSLEEIFISEMEELGYEIKDKIL